MLPLCSCDPTALAAARLGLKGIYSSVCQAPRARAAGVAGHMKLERRTLDFVASPRPAAINGRHGCRCRCRALGDPARLRVTEPLEFRPELVAPGLEPLPSVDRALDAVADRGGQLDIRRLRDREGIGVLLAPYVEPGEARPKALIREVAWDLERDAERAGIRHCASPALEHSTARRYHRQLRSSARLASLLRS